MSGNDIIKIRSILTKNHRKQLEKGKTIDICFLNKDQKTISGKKTYFSNVHLNKNDDFTWSIWIGDDKDNVKVKQDFNTVDELVKWVSDVQYLLPSNVKIWLFTINIYNEDDNSDTIEKGYVYRCTSSD